MKKLLSVGLHAILFSCLCIPSNQSCARETTSYTIAVLDLEANGVSNVEAKGLSEKIRTRIAWLVTNASYRSNPATNKYSVVERSQMDRILDQFDIQSTVCTDVSCAVEFGRMLQADRIIIGSVNLIGRTYNITTRMIDIASAQSLSVSEVDYRGSIDGLLGAPIQNVADELLLGRTFDDWENSEIVSITGNPENAAVSINGKKAGTTPVQSALVSVGATSVTITKQGYEKHTERFRLQKGEPHHLTYTLWPKTRTRAFVKSLYFSGSGQWYAEHKGKGFLITLAQLATLAGVVETTMHSIETRQDYDDARDAYHSSASQDVFDESYRLMEDTYDTAQKAQTYQLIAAGAALTVYIYNLIDAALTVPKTEERFGQRSLGVEPRLSKEYTSITVSMRF